MVSHPDLQHSQEAKWGRSLVNMAIISPLLGFVTTNHLALLILSLLTYLAHFPIYWSQARDFKGLAFLAHSVRITRPSLVVYTKTWRRKLVFRHSDEPGPWYEAETYLIPCCTLVLQATDKLLPRNTITLSSSRQIIRCSHPLNTWPNCYSMTTDVLCEECQCGAHCSQQVSAMVTTWWLQCDQTLPLCEGCGLWG